jgi:hypothetical protein
MSEQPRTLQSSRENQGTNTPTDSAFHARSVFLVALLIICSGVGGWVGTEYALVNNIHPYTGPHRAGTQVISAGELIAGLRGGIAGGVVGVVLGVFALVWSQFKRLALGWRPLRAGATIGGVAGAIAGFMGVAAPNWAGLAAGCVVGTVVGLVRWYAHD